MYLYTSPGPVAKCTSRRPYPRVPSRITTRVRLVTRRRSTRPPDSVRATSVFRRLASKAVSSAGAGGRRRPSCRRQRRPRGQRGRCGERPFRRRSPCRAVFCRLVPHRRSKRWPGSVRAPVGIRLLQLGQPGRVFGGGPQPLPAAAQPCAGGFARSARPTRPGCCYAPRHGARAGWCSSSAPGRVLDVPIVRPRRAPSAVPLDLCRPW